MQNNGWMPCMNCMMNMQPMMQDPMMTQQPMMMNDPMMTQQPMMMNDPMMDIEEENLKMMYPKIYVKLMPMVKHHCDKHEETHGKMHCPSHEDIKDMSNNIYKNIEGELDEDNGDDDDDKKRVRQYGRGNAVRDLVGVLLLNELIGRRRRRRRPRPYYGGY